MNNATPNNGLARYRASVSERKHAAILKSAEAVFAKGFESACMADVARQADVSTATLYKHCGSKEELLHMVIDVIYAREGQRAVTQFVMKATFLSCDDVLKTGSQAALDARDFIANVIDSLNAPVASEAA